MKAKFKVNDKVEWKWLGGRIEGVVKEVHFERVTRLLKGKCIKRIGSPERPAYLVQSVAGNLALKLQSELTARTKLRAKTGRD